MVPLVILPQACESAPIRPDYLALAIPAAGLELSLVLCLLYFICISIMMRWQAIVILECSITIGSSILEAAHEPVSILVGDLGLPVEPAVEELAAPAILILDYVALNLRRLGL